MKIIIIKDLISCILNSLGNLKTDMITNDIEIDNDLKHYDSNEDDYDDYNSDDEDDDMNYYSDINQDLNTNKLKVELLQRYPNYQIWLKQIFEMESFSDWIISYSNDNIFEVYFTLYYGEEIRGSFIWINNPDKSYPNFPPSMKWLSPKLDFDKMLILFNLSLFDPKNWNPCQDLISILNYLKIFILNSKIFLDENTKYNDFENIIIRFCELTNMWPECDHFDNLPSFGIKITNEANICKNSGKGYSKGRICNLDLSKQDDKFREIFEILKFIYDNEISSESETYNLDNRKFLINFKPFKYFIYNTLRELSFLDIHNNIDFYDLIVKITEWFYLNDSDPQNNLLYVEMKKFGLKIKNNNLMQNLNIPHNKFEKQVLNLIRSMDKISFESLPSKIEEDIYLDFLRSKKVEFSENFSNTYFKGNKYEIISQTKNLINRLKAEWLDLQSNLPVEHSGSIFINWSSQQFNLAKIMFIPSSETPYAYGCYIFDLLITNEYPDTCPKIQFLTTDGGNVRFNPNLYNEGKVCLSLLGTWTGESWNPKKSNLLQLLMSILGMIFVEDPFFNEPCYTGKESLYKKQSLEYNQNIRYENLRVAIKNNLKYPIPEFKEIIYHHFRCKKSELNIKINSWIDDEPTENKKNMMKTLLQKINLMI